MTHEPDETPSTGGLDMNALLQQAQRMQQELVSARGELAETEVEGTAGGVVTVAVDGTGELVRVDFASGGIDPDDTETLGDLVVAAYRDAKTRADQMAADKLGPLAGGLGDLGGLGGSESGSEGRGMSPGF